VTAEELLAKARRSGVTIAVAESCTGGLLSKLLTDVPGASDVFLGGAVTYANAAKTKLLGVKQKTLEAHGAVSWQTAKEMARGARRKFGATVAVAVTGIAGPGGGTKEKPVGTVWIAWTAGRRCEAVRCQFSGTRGEIRAHGAATALQMLSQALDAVAPRPGR
jgi:PncC family amidohydrolase